MQNQKPKASGYSEAGASYSKRALKAFRAISSSPNEDINFNNATLRQRGRILYMSTPVAAAAINTTRTKSVGPGLYCKPAIDYKTLGISENEAVKWQMKTEAEFRLWAESKDCDALGVNNFYELEQLALMSWLMSGDVFALLKRYDPTVLQPYTLRIHLIEADRISTPDRAHYPFGPDITNGENENNHNKIYDGVEVNSNGKVVAYYISNNYPNELIDREPQKWTRVEAVGKLTGLPNILQVFNAERPEQYRGVSYLAPIIEVALQERRYTEASLTAAIIQTYLTAWIIINSPNPSDNPLNKEGEDPTPNVADDEQSMGPGNILHLQDGEDVRFGNPNIPVAGFLDFMKTLHTMVGAALEIPYDVLLKEFNASYSASKGALEEASQTITMRRSWFVADFCQPIYEVWLAEAVATGRINAPGFWSDPLLRKAWCGARWDGPSQIHLDPLKEARANEIQVRHAWKSNEQITREKYGGDWNVNKDVVRRENEAFPIVATNDGGTQDNEDE